MKSNGWNKLWVLGAALALLLVGGCGEGGRESPHRGLTAAETAARGLGTDTAGHEYVGTDRCLECHLDGAATCASCHSRYSTGLSTAEAFAFLESAHVNHSDRIDASAESASCRAACHDPVGDGPLIEDRVAAVPARGLAAVGCEACHGGGALHFGSRGSIPVAHPDFEVCGRCHTEELSALHTEDHPEGARILAAYRNSGHARSINEHTQVVEGSADTTAVCSKCHSDQGAKTYRDTAPADIPYSRAPVKGAASVQCRTCHDPHNPEALLMAETQDASAEYRTCTMCHQTAAGYHGADSDYSWSGYSVGVGTFDAGRIIYDTHFDDPATDGIEGYNIQATSHRACRACHDVHAADPTINAQWARSGHAGKIAAVKAAETQPDAILTAAVGDATGPAWAHYDFKAANRQGCQRCHTTTGFVNYTTDPGRYNAASNDFSHLAGEQREMLYCNGCHADNAGTRRQPGAIVAKYPEATPVEVVPYPDLGDSNLCMACHSGRDSGQSVKAKAEFTNADRPAAHYLTAGAMLFGELGYTYAASGEELDYSTPATESHHRIGESAAVLDATSVGEGPCVVCHMRTAEPHRFAAVEKDPDGTITEILSTACAACHKNLGYTDLTLTVDDLNQLSSDYADALTALQTQLAAAGFYRYEKSPYYYSSASFDPNYVEAGGCDTNLPIRNWQSGGTTTWVWNLETEKCDPSVEVAGLAGSGANNMGAAFNLHLLRNEPGAYVHNHYYVRRLVYDSIDWLDDGVLNSSTLTTITSGAGHTNQPHQDGAFQFLSDLGR